ncbi:hypothetical protein ABT270_25595 [Streptomyces sp900105245]|uniref:hypothetical protein n=1 Tax=Streptomyces sp. 900105245 TaxID=3154379 RepID=UPI00331F3854
MIVSVSAAALLLGIVILLIRQGYVRLGSAAACIAFGFCLASTGLAPAITSALTAAARLASLH